MNIDLNTASILRASVELCKFLNEVSNSGTHAVSNHSVGMCSSILYQLGNVEYNLFKRLYLEWPEYSRDPDYPIEDPEGNASAEEYYWDTPLWTGENLDARMRLADWGYKKLLTMTLQEIIDLYHKEIPEE